MNLLTEEEIFAAALQKAPEERAAFLDRACQGDLQLRAAVEALLKAHDHPDSFLEHPLGEATIDQPLTENPGSVIGLYKLLQQIGEGGFGIVYMAEQVEPVRRRVALKVIKPGMDTRQVIARFEAERQALAVMDHPNIAKVLDAGTTESGRPYFVMELVRGAPITQYCDENNLPVRERLELFATVCQAIQHAHTKGIIHRDIKPTNVLVTRQEGQAVVKVIDFGVAKAMGQQLTDKTLFTDFAQMIGTPLYMSPEQAELSSTDIDTRSDIYSLGVLLYELLTGSTPVTKEQLKQAAFDEIRRIIREEEPPKPSTRISTAEAAPSIAAQRHTEPAKLARLVRGELDWIVMKALEKDRARRYETANGFAADVQRYLNDEAVQACPPSPAYRFRKFARRNWRVVATVSLITVSLVLATIISLFYAHQAKADRQLALQKAREANTSAETARAEADKSAAVIRLLQDMLLSSNPDAAKGPNYTLRELLDEFSQRLEEQLHNQPEVEATLRQIVGSVYTELRLPERAEPHLKRSLLLHREVFGEDHLKVANILGLLARNRWMQHAGNDVEAFARESLRIYQMHGDVAGELKARNLLFMNVWGEFRLDDAERMAEDTILFARSHNLENDSIFPTILHNLSGIKNAKGDNAAALRLAREAVDKHLHAYGETKNSTAWGYFYLGWALRDNGRLPEAEESFRKSLSVFRKFFPASDARAVGRAVVELRDTLEARGDAAALASLEQEYPREVMAANYDLAAHVDLLYGNRTRAVARLRNAIEFGPTAQHHERLAWLLATSLEDNVRDSSQAVRLAEKAVELAPHDAACWNTLGVARYRIGDFDGALAALQKFREFRADDGEWSNAFFLAMAHWRKGNKDVARQWYQKGVEWMERNAPTDVGLILFRAESAELLELKEKKQNGSNVRPSTDKSGR